MRARWRVAAGLAFGLLFLAATGPAQQPGTKVQKYLDGKTRIEYTPGQPVGSISPSMGMTDAAVRELAQIPEYKGLKSLDLSGNFRMTDAGLAVLTAFKSLDSLTLHANPNITDAGLKEVTRLKTLT